MVDPAPVPASDKADPANAQFVVSITPEQYEAKLKAKEAPARTSMEVGGTGTAKVSFKDALGADVKIVSSTWQSSSPSVTVIPVETDVTSALLTAVHPGHAAIHTTVQSESGHTGTASTEVMVIETGTPADGKIELTVQPAAKVASA